MTNNLSRFVGVRFKPDDYERLEKKAKEVGTTVSDLIRAAALKVKLTPHRRRLADKELINQLSRVGNNLNQQTRLLHQLHLRGLTPDTAPVVAAVEDVRELLVKVARSVSAATAR